MAKDNFIITFDIGAAKALKESGYKQIKVNNGNGYVFVNNGNVFNDNVDRKKITYTNILTF